MTAGSLAPAAPAARQRLRIGFVGVGWIGLHRMRAMIDCGLIDIAVVADPTPEAVDQAGKLAPDAEIVGDLDAVLERDVDGVVIATPTALHAAQALRALSHGVAVFCQKPLGRTAQETRAVVEAARAADRLLCVDFSYRYTEPAQYIRGLVRSGRLGRVYAADLTFHNAYGPDKAWFYDRARSGGGCVIDLGVHLIDLALWILDFPPVRTVESHLFAGGAELALPPECVEDFGIATLELASGAVVRIACSWRLHAGCDAEISAVFYGTEGGASLRNVNGSFYDLVGTQYRGTSSEIFAVPPDPWGGRASVHWAQRLVNGEGFDEGAQRVVDVASAIDRVYGRQHGTSSGT